ncbi:helix-turn-helix domain-containing protein [Candidatus Synechococcus calcipolaris G9]|uniref:Helix-turn-helix domain-containing protein n=1 Tax=Candidatus Synechococcus calcipolaris G9 TaxID=1497997 RepID=A0ABT6F2B7_9SYNE|nr:S24 family peptidase [Candidatus Synechococcus calcipolaris]MDG2992001.1 helix-turn-helix domain-containing protein [Candidatus Synechococcus calcipolaris G9]
MNRPEQRFSLGIGQRLLHLRGKRSRQTFADLLGIGHRSLVRYEKEERLPDAEVLARICQVFEVDPMWLLMGKYRERPTVLIPRYDLEAAAGTGTFLESEGAIDALSLDLDWLVQELKVNPQEAGLLTVRGDSMEPTLFHGDSLLFTRRLLDPLQEGIYLIRCNALLMVKRLLPKPGKTLLIASDNSAYPPFSISVQTDPDDFAILGRVVWSGRRLRG